MAEDQGAGILIGTPLVGRPTARFTASLVSLIKPARCQWTYIPNRPCDIARNLLVEECLEGGWDFLFMLDADMCFEPETVLRLNMRKELLIAGLCFTRVLPPMPAAYRGQTTVTEEGWPRYRVRAQETLEWLELNAEHLSIDRPSVILPDQPGALMEYDSTGGACVLIHRSVLEGIEPPWFQYTYPDRMVGEDFYFYQKAKAAGFRLVIDRTVIVGHQYGDQYIGAVDFVSFMYARLLQNMPKLARLAAGWIRKAGLG